MIKKLPKYHPEKNLSFTFPKINFDPFPKGQYLFLLNLTQYSHIYSNTECIYLYCSLKNNLRFKILYFNTEIIFLSWHITVCNKNGRVLKESEILFCHKDRYTVFTNPQDVNTEVETYSFGYILWSVDFDQSSALNCVVNIRKRKYHARNLNIF